VLRYVVDQAEDEALAALDAALAGSSAIAAPDLLHGPFEHIGWSEDYRDFRGVTDVAAARFRASPDATYAAGVGMRQWQRVRGRVRQKKEVASDCLVLPLAASPPRGKSQVKSGWVRGEA
jgi:hypothetical protein